MAHGESSILVVDDDASDLKLFVRVLGELGELKALKEPNDVLPHIERDRPDVVVLDALLPGTSGLDLCKKIKSSRKLRDTRVLIVTGVYLRPHMRDEALSNFKADAFLTKPFRAPELQRLVIQLLSEKTREPQGRWLRKVGLPVAPKDQKADGTFFQRLLGRLRAPTEEATGLGLSGDVGVGAPLGSDSLGDETTAVSQQSELDELPSTQAEKSAKSELDDVAVREKQSSDDGTETGKEAATQTEADQPESNSTELARDNKSDTQQVTGDKDKSKTKKSVSKTTKGKKSESKRSESAPKSADGPESVLGSSSEEEVSATVASSKETSGKKATAKEATAKEATAKEATAKEATAKEATAKEATAKEATTKKATAKEANTKEANTKEATTKEATTKEATTKEESKTSRLGRGGAASKSAGFLAAAVRMRGSGTGKSKVEKPAVAPGGSEEPQHFKPSRSAPSDLHKTARVVEPPSSIAAGSRAEFEASDPEPASPVPAAPVSSEHQTPTDSTLDAPPKRHADGAGPDPGDDDLDSPIKVPAMTALEAAFSEVADPHNEGLDADYESPESSSEGDVAPSDQEFPGESESGQGVVSPPTDSRSNESKPALQADNDKTEKSTEEPARSDGALDLGADPTAMTDPRGEAPVQRDALSPASAAATPDPKPIEPHFTDADSAGESAELLGPSSTVRLTTEDLKTAVRPSRPESSSGETGKPVEDTASAEPQEPRAADSAQGSPKKTRTSIRRVIEIPVFGEADFHYELQRELAKCRRLDRPLTLILLQVTDMAQIIELFGQSALDPVLWHVSEQAVSSLRDIDAVGLMRTEKLVALMVFASERYGGSRVMTRVRTALMEHPFHAHAGLPPITPKIRSGMSSFPREAKNVAELFERAYFELSNRDEPKS